MSFKKGNVPWNVDKNHLKYKEYIEIVREVGKKRKGKSPHNKNRTKENYDPLKRTSKTLKEKYKNDKNIKCGFNEKNSPSKKIKNRKKASIRMKKNNPMYLLKGEKHPHWNNGSSFEPYSVDWTKTLKRSIKERDKFRCHICGSDNKLMVHHIDYNKKNCNLDNLVTLCNSCHSKTNSNRNKWIKYFKDILRCQ